MKLVISHSEAQQIIAERFNLLTSSVEIQPEEKIGGSISDLFDDAAPVGLTVRIRQAIDTIFTEGYNAGAASALGAPNFHINKISLIKAARDIAPGTSLKDGKEFVEAMINRP